MSTGGEGFVPPGRSYDKWDITLHQKQPPERSQQPALDPKREVGSKLQHTLWPAAPTVLNSVAPTQHLVPGTHFTDSTEVCRK